MQGISPHLYMLFGEQTEHGGVCEAIEYDKSPCHLSVRIVTASSYWIHNIMIHEGHFE